MKEKMLRKEKREQNRQEKEAKWKARKEDPSFKKFLMKIKKKKQQRIR